jgi:hypothetical protein
LVQAQSIAGAAQDKYDPCRAGDIYRYRPVIGGSGAALLGKRLAPGASDAATPAPHAQEGLPLGMRGEEPRSDVSKSEVQPEASKELPTSSTAAGDKDLGLSVEPGKTELNRLVQRVVGFPTTSSNF